MILQSIEKKAKAEDKYFYNCQREAAAAAAQTNNNKKSINNQLKEQEVALFGKQGSQGINFAKYDDIKVDVKMGETTAGEKQNIDTFTDYDELQLSPQLKKNITLMKYTKSTPIQRHAVPLGIAGHDLMCCAQTGSGKTCAFLLPVIASLQNKQQQKTENDNNMHSSQPVRPKCIILAPTRELASQIELEAEKLCFNTSHVSSVAVYGGADQKKQIRELAFAAVNDGNVIVVATPGRLTDFVERNIISLSDTKFLVL